MSMTKIFFAKFCRCISGIFVAALFFVSAAHGQTITEYRAGITQDFYPPKLHGIASGSNGNLWFMKTEGDVWSFGQMTTNGVTLPFRGAENTNTFYRPLFRPVAGPDGNVWYASWNKITRMTPTGVVTDFSNGIPSGSTPTAIAVGSDGNLWFTQQNTAQDGTPNQIGRITPSGVVTNFNVGITPNSKPIEIVLGADGNMWFTEYYAHKIGRITPSGVITEFGAGAFPSNLILGNDGKLWYMSIVYSSATNTYDSTIYRMSATGANEIVARIPGTARPGSGAALGADGNYWFTVPETNKIVRVSPSRVLTEFVAGTNPNASPNAIAAGADGNLWFTNWTGGQVGRITTSGVVTEFSAGAGIVTRKAAPTRAARGPDGNIWFTMEGTSKIGKITPAGVISEFSAGATPDSGPFGITAGVDGNLWFTWGARYRAIGGIGRITPSGIVTEFNSTQSNFRNPFFSQPRSILSGPDGNLWFTTSASGFVSRITPDGQLAEFAGAAPPSSWSGETDIAVGLDGNLWFTKNANVKSIVKITPSGIVTEYDSGADFVYGITAGADGNIWFGSYKNGGGGYRISRMSLNGAVTNFPINASSPLSGRFPYNGKITTGSDGNVWFPLAGERVGRITPSGQISIFRLAVSLGAEITDMAVGADGNFWLPLSGVDAIAKMTLPAEIIPTLVKSQTITVRSNRSQLFTGRWANNKIQFTPQSDPGQNFRVVGVVDIDGNGQADLVIQDMSVPGEFGEVRAWGNSLSTNERPLRTVKRVWNVQAVGDLDGDGNGDLVWRYMLPGSYDTGVSYIWFTNGGNVSQVRKRGGAPLDWRLLGAIDVNGDGAADMVYISPNNEIRVLMATPNRTCANFGVEIPTSTSPFPVAEMKIFGLGTFGTIPGTQISRAAIMFSLSSNNRLQLMYLDANALSLPVATGNPDDPNASCTSTPQKITSRLAGNFAFPPIDSEFYSAADLNGDGITDVIWRLPDNSLTVYLLKTSGEPLSIINNAGTLPQ